MDFCVQYAVAKHLIIIPVNAVMLSTLHRADLTGTDITCHSIFPAAFLPSYYVILNRIMDGDGVPVVGWGEQRLQVQKKVSENRVEVALLLETFTFIRKNLHL